MECMLLTRADEVAAAMHANLGHKPLPCSLFAPSMFLVRPTSRARCPGSPLPGHAFAGAALCGGSLWLGQPSTRFALLRQRSACSAGGDAAGAAALAGREGISCDTPPWRRHSERVAEARTMGAGGAASAGVGGIGGATIGDNYEIPRPSAWCVCAARVCA
eukprot:327749-Chlamydomonas_euryale.AAC.2